MAKNDSQVALDKALEHVSSDRRDFLKRLFAGAAASAALPLISSDAGAQPFPFGKGFFKGMVKGYDPYYGGGYYGKGAGGGKASRSGGGKASVSGGGKASASGGGKASRSRSRSGSGKASRSGKGSGRGRRRGGGKGRR